MLSKNMGLFISFEGADGSGKSTNAKRLADLIEHYGYSVVRTREPGGSPVGEQLRSVILNSKASPMSELLMFAASRAEHIETVIKPALATGKVVICDRFSDSTYAYQGVGRGYVEEVLKLEKFVHEGFEPDYTLFFDITLEESKKRLLARFEKMNHLDKEDDAFKTKVFMGYQERFAANPHRMVLINSMGNEDEVYARVKKWADSIFYTFL